MSATNHTPNYSLPQWVGTDPVLMADFNAAFSAVDTGMKANADAAAAAARVVVGSYTGNGAATRSISLGGRPKAVLVMQSGAKIMSPNSSDPLGTDLYGGLSVTGANSPAVTITGTGFDVFCDSEMYHYRKTNSNYVSYIYVALL